MMATGKRVISRVLIRVLLCLLTFLGSLIGVYAQGPDEEGASSLDVPSGQLSLTFEQLGYDVKELSRDRPSRSFRIDLPGNFQVSPTGNYLELITHHLPEVPDKPSVLQVTVGGSLLDAFPLTADNAVSNTVRIDLPEDLFQAGSIRIGVDLDTSATCEDLGAIVDVLIDPASAITLGYWQNPYPTDLSLYPFPFIETSLQSIPVTLVLPDQPTSDDLTTAATVAAGLGQMSGGTIDLTAVLASGLGSDIRHDSHLVVIGKPDYNTLLSSLVLPLPINSAELEPGQGVLEEIVSPWNEFRLILIVSGLDDEGMLKACHALNREAHFLGMRGHVAVVTQLGTVPRSVAQHEASMSLGSLGYEDQIVYGAAPQDLTLHFTLPLGWQLEILPFFVLKFSHASILDPADSAIDILLNGVPIGSTLLNEANAAEGELTVSLPGHLLEPGRNRLEMAIEMNFPASSRNKCRDLQDQRAWTVISSESEIFLPYNAIDLPPDLSLLPYPFSQSSGMDHTLIVLPDHPSPPILDDLIRLAVLLGSPNRPGLVSARVAYAAEVDEESRRDYHLILLGRPTENALLRAANAYLPQPFVPGSDALEPLAVDSVAFMPDPSRGAGLLEIISSPWSEDHSLLAITGTTDDGVRLAAQVFWDPSRRLEGNLAVVEPTFNSLTGETIGVSTYAIDTRSPSTLADEDTGTYKDSTSVRGDLFLLAERWWK
jgi:hypothetical protein